VLTALSANCLNGRHTDGRNRTNTLQQNWLRKDCTQFTAYWTPLPVFIRPVSGM